MSQDKVDPVVMNEIQLILAEKRTSLAYLRTGIAVFALPLSVLSVLVATSKIYRITDVLEIFITLVILSAGLAVLGTYLVHSSVMKIRRNDRLINKLLRSNCCLREFIE